MAEVRKYSRKKSEVGLKSLTRKVLQFQPAKSFYSTQEVMDLTGLSREKIEYMCTKGFIAEPRRKFSRSRSKLALLFFPVRDVLKALIIADIRAAGFSFQQVRKLAENLEELGVELDERAFLLTDGDSIQVADSNEQVVDVLRHKRQMYLLVSLEDQVAKLRA